ncbi:hypothetical protein Pla163_13120 [Planctomycetes bacterium Pla163]|uniref:Uncharacterized protein n=1 Tax=Rohdeia mirabilis TaxID=2528008 RepID=A0A518CYD6_9BACT|nr:hypothetical protein Pla163_13120 [Planctomycetes bacterium Pla163]
MTDDLEKPGTQAADQLGPNEPSTAATTRADEVGSTSARSTRGFGRVFALLSVPFVLFTGGVVYVVGFGDLAREFRDIAIGERVSAVRYAIEFTPAARVPHLLFAVDRPPAEWDRRQVEAALDLIERADWPGPQGASQSATGVTTAQLLAAAPERWSADEVDAAAELLQRFRSFHTTRR